MEHNYQIEGDSLVLRPLIHEDIEFLRLWRNDREATRFLKEIPYITAAMQESWFADYLQNDDIICFAILEKKDLKHIIGSVSLYEFHGNECEVGKIQIGDPGAHGKHYGAAAMAMICAFAFEKLGIRKINAIVNVNNAAACKSYRAVGFQFGQKTPSKSSVGGEDYHISLTRGDLLL